VTGIDDPLWRKNRFEVGAAGAFRFGRTRIDEMTASRTVGAAQVALQFYFHDTIVIGLALALDADLDAFAITPFIAPNWRLSERVYLRSSLGFGPELGEHTALRVRVDTRLVIFATRRVGIFAGPELSVAIGYTEVTERVSYVELGVAGLAGLSRVF